VLLFLNVWVLLPSCLRVWLVLQLRSLGIYQLLLQLLSHVCLRLLQLLSHLCLWQLQQLLLSLGV
jgi:hypothetical protein